MDYIELEGREIEDIQYTGLVESLAVITLICSVVAETSSDITKDDLVVMIAQINGEALKCFAFAGATRPEVAEMTAHLLKGMHRVS